MGGSPIDRARALWGRTGDEAPAGPAEPTGLDEYLNAIEEQERTETTITPGARETQLRALEAFAASPISEHAFGDDAPPEAARPGRIVGLDWPPNNHINLDDWRVTLGKFSWSLSTKEQAAITKIMNEALRRHLEDEHSDLINRLAHANEVSPMASEAEEST